MVAPAAPNLGVINNRSTGGRTVDISWTFVSGATNYWLYRSTVSIADANVNGTRTGPYTSSSVAYTLPNGWQTFYFVVKASNAANEFSGPSNGHSINSIPYYVDSVSATSMIGYAQVSFTANWDGSAENVDGYWIYRDGVGINNYIGHPGNGVSVTHYDYPGDSVLHTYTVKAYDTESSFSPPGNSASAGSRPVGPTLQSTSGDEKTGTTITVTAAPSGVNRRYIYVATGGTGSIDPTSQYTLWDSSFTNSNSYYMGSLGSSTRFFVLWYWESSVGTSDATRFSFVPALYEVPTPWIYSVSPGDGYVDVTFYTTETTNTVGWDVSSYGLEPRNYLGQGGYSANNYNTYRVTGLTNGVQYKFAVRAHSPYGGGDISDWSGYFYATPVPVPVATAPSLSGVQHYNAILLQWNYVTGATSYTVLENNGGIGTSAINSYVRRGISVASRDYRVKGTNANPTDGPLSNIVSIAPLSLSGASVTLSSATESSQQVTLAWTGFYGIDAWHIERAVGEGAFTEISNNTSLADTISCSFVDTGLTNGQAYRYRIRARNVVGGTTQYSNYSNILYAVPNPAGSGGDSAGILRG